MSSFDDESVLFDPSDEKKQKHKAPRRIRGILDGGQKKLKVGKKEKKTRAQEAFTRLSSGELKEGEKSAEWASFQQMQDRIRWTVLTTQAKISRLETGFEEELEKLASNNESSPWRQDEVEQLQATNVKTGWEGFDDNFAASPNIELSKNLSHLTLTPIGSPKSTPLPPHNSRRASVEDYAKCMDADLLGLNTEAGTTKPDASPIDDLLGGLTDTKASALSVDFISDSLSRNEMPSALSSGYSTPAEQVGEQSSALGTSIIDDFLGISTGDMPKTKAVQDPMEMLEQRKASQNMISSSALDDPFDVSKNIAEVDDDDDAFGLGFWKDSQRTMTSRPAGDLFMFDDKDRQNENTNLDTNLYSSLDTNLKSPLSDEFDPRAGLSGTTQPATDNTSDLWAASTVKSQNPFRDNLADYGLSFANTGMSTSIPFIDDRDLHDPVSDVNDFNPFATITDDPVLDSTDAFNPFQTIHDDDAFEVHFPEGSDVETVSPTRFNPFDKEPPLDEKFANFEPSPEAALEASLSSTVESSFEEEDMTPFEPFRLPFEKDGWQMMIRQPAKKKLTHNRFWKSVYVRLGLSTGGPMLQIFRDDVSKETLQELVLQSGYNLCNMGLQTYDQFGKCHTVKIQYIFYRERIGVKAERVTPTLSDLTRVRDLKSLRDLVHKPKTTMILDHAPQASELLKFGSLNYADFCTFISQVEDTLFRLPSIPQERNLPTYSKDEITVDIIDEYSVEIDVHGHIVMHKARVRMFCLSFLSGCPVVEVGINDKRRQGKEVVGRQDIIPIKTEQWIRIYEPEFHSSVSLEEYEKTRVIKLRPMDASQFEMLRFRVRPKLNKELPLLIQVRMSVVDKHVQIRAELIIPGYHSNSRKETQMPCEDIQIRFPLPEDWIYLLRVEKRFRYGSLKSATRKPGKIKGLERLSMIAQGMLPPSLIEVSTGIAKYEHVYRCIVWRISQLPERNQGAYKTHLFALKLDLGAHDIIPDNYEPFAHVEYNVRNSTVSRAQVRSISIDTDTEPDKWVHHVARYEYQVAIEFLDKLDGPVVEGQTITAETLLEEEEGEEDEAAAMESGDSDSSDTD